MPNDFLSFFLIVSIRILRWMKISLLFALIYQLMPHIQVCFQIVNLSDEQSQQLRRLKQTMHVRLCCRQSTKRQHFASFICFHDIPTVSILISRIKFWKKNGKSDILQQNNFWFPAMICNKNVYIFEKNNLTFRIVDLCCSCIIKNNKLSKKLLKITFENKNCTMKNFIKKLPGAKCTFFKCCKKKNLFYFLFFETTSFKAFWK